MTSVIKKNGYENSFVNFILIVLAGMNVFEHGSIVLFLFAFLNLFIFGKMARPHVDLQMIVLLLFFIIGGISSFIYLSLTDAIIETVKLSNYFTLYLVSKIGYQVANNKEKYIKTTIFAMFLGVFINLAVFYFYNLWLGNVAVSRRFLVNVWTGEEVRATLIGLMSCVVVGYSFYGLFVTKNILTKTISLFALILTLIINLETATRTPLIMLLVIYLFLFVVMFFVVDQGKFLGFAAVLFCLFLSFAVLFAFNIFGVKEFMLNSPLYQRLNETGLETSRVTIVKNYFKLMPQHLWGGKVLSQRIGKTPHNLWQQVYDIYGFFPMVLMMVSTIQMIKAFISVLKKTKNSKVALLLVSVVGSMLLQCAIEPIITGFPILLWFLLMITGMANSWIEDAQCEMLSLNKGEANEMLGAKEK